MVPRGPPESISVRRRLDFSNENLDASTADKRTIGRSPQKRVDSRTAGLAKGKSSQAQPVQAVSEDDEQEDAQDQYYDNDGDSYQIMDGGDVDLDNPVPESDPEPEPAQKPKGKGKAKEPAATKPPGKRGRPKRKSDATEENDDREPPTKKTRRSLEGPKAAPNGKSKKAAAAEKPKPKPTTAAGKGRPKKTNLATISENESPAVQRGPPMPRNNRGLVILRRETPMDSNGFKQTRSGRNSVRPVAYWKNERIEYSEDENVYYNGGNFLLPKIKGVIRADEVEETRPKRSHKPSKSKSKNRAATVESEEEEDDIEPWETEPGRLVGEIREWDPEDPTGMHAEEVEEEIAISSSAIETRDIAGATFRFAKTLTMPFFGSGVVDLPPGSEKKPKNSRKMQMVFFVFYGRVEVTVNDSTFRIGKGGMWQVPRG
jgi:centromere protein C